MNDYTEGLYRATGWDHLDFGSIDNITTGKSKEKFPFSIEQMDVLIHHSAAMKHFEARRLDEGRLRRYKRGLSQQVNNRFKLVNQLTEQ